MRHPNPIGLEDYNVLFSMKTYNYTIRVKILHLLILTARRSGTSTTLVVLLCFVLTHTLSRVTFQSIWTKPWGLKGLLSNIKNERLTNLTLELKKKKCNYRCFSTVFPLYPFQLFFRRIDILLGKRGNIFVKLLGIYRKRHTSKSPSI